MSQEKMLTNTRKDIKERVSVDLNMVGSEEPRKVMRGRQGLWRDPRNQGPGLRRVSVHL